MKRAVWTVVILCCFDIQVHAETRTLALYVKQTESLHVPATQTAQSELRRLFGPVGIDVLWKGFSERKTGEDFDFVAIVSIAGSCTPSVQPANDRSMLRGLVSLADTSVSKTEVLPFFTVNCDHLVAAMGNQTPSIMGHALAHLIGHELYHIVAKTTEHQHAGIAKAVFTFQDLVSPGLNFDFTAQVKMRGSPSIARSGRRVPSKGRFAS
jgi:hypothetical protein